MTTNDSTPLTEANAHTYLRLTATRVNRLLLAGATIDPKDIAILADGVIRLYHERLRLRVALEEITGYDEPVSEEDSLEDMRVLALAMVNHALTALGPYPAATTDPTPNQAPRP